MPGSDPSTNPRDPRGPSARPATGGAVARPDGSRPKRHRALWIGAAVMLGALGGLGSFTFGYGDGWAYLGNDPASCANCHVMQEHFDSWQHSSHHGVATCNDCHLSHHPVGKWVTKADNGFFHSLAFTTGGFREPIRIKERNRRVTQQACVHCHGDLVHGLLDPAGDDPSCVRCHQSVGHGLR